MSWRGSTTVSDRIFACLPYLFPLIEGLGFGKYLFRQFPILKQTLVWQLPPLLMADYSIPFAELIILFALYFGVVRNENISHFVRFNAMQAILLYIVLILAGLILHILVPSIPIVFIIETISNMIFLGIVAAVGYAVVQSALGRYAEIPTISDAVYMQVR
ncbi:MAG: hypothetical protein N3E45_06780 [Oscillatoriaceae bacterium SKW80]|nr:hypothetical protein [Oscillatoriaceae bacterium SKYG93]MCX8120519.1 hypothetical protein [Oscillatoriaceae bacterium SKW80]MDW8452757.1 Tic20 family protein [Oscillatoriaceae cyanobacterium SKYGB_i_bin93]HIK27173.1 hypothetical protein [Oscillatoriaceae cyanobacterium M7585_C2015_266]